MTYQNDSFIAEHWNDQLFDRSEDIGEDPICQECKGEGQTEYCITCGNHESDCECDEPDLITEECDKCLNGRR